MTTTTEVTVPDVGDFADVPVVEIHVAVGDSVDVEDPLVTLESDKATVDVPSPAAGKVQALQVSIGDRVSQGSIILTLEAADAPSAPPVSGAGKEPPAAVAASNGQEPPPAGTAGPADQAPAAGTPADFAGVHAGPSVRRLARELEVDLTNLTGTGPNGRITKEDLLDLLPGPAGPAPAAPAVTGGAGIPAVTGGAGIPPVPAQDFSKFGPIETRPLGRIQQISGPHLQRSWLNVPHVTQHDEADITDLDTYRRELDADAKASGYRVTLLAFLLKASVASLKTFPEVNSSLSPIGDSLVLKRYYHLGVAVDTDGGLVVPVLRDVDRKGLLELSQELGSLSAKSRGGQLTPSDLQGASFTISSLGGIGGTAFTPIVNAPEVAILGVSRAKTAPVWDGERFVPRLMLPVSFSYDHRVVDGALAARWTRHLCERLEDVRRLLL